jgi:hypothetical protein
MDYSGQNINRVNAVKQLKKGINDSNIDIDIDYDDRELLTRFLRVGASVANSLIYIGDVFKERNDILKEELEYKMRLDEQLSLEGGN